MLTVYQPSQEVIQRVLEFFEKHKERSFVKVGISAKEMVVLTRADVFRKVVAK